MEKMLITSVGIDIMQKDIERKRQAHYNSTEGYAPNYPNELINDLFLALDALFIHIENLENEMKWHKGQPSRVEGKLIAVLHRTYGAFITTWKCVDGGGHPENGPEVYYWDDDRIEQDDDILAWLPIQDPPKEGV